MSMKRLAILAAAGHAGGLNFTQSTTNMTTSPGGSGRSGAAGSLHGNVNVLLGGAMLSGVILVVFLVCYCCHRNMRKHASPYSNYWREPEVPLEVFTLASQTQCYESAGLFLSETHSLEIGPPPPIRPPTPGPPPAYDAVVSPTEKDKLASEYSDGPDFDSYTISEPKRRRSSSLSDRRHDGNNIGESLPSDETGLPSYEAALRLEAGGYV